MLSDSRSMEACIKEQLTGYVAPFVNLFLHGTILAVILIVFFLYVIVPVSADAMNGQFIGLATSNLTPILSNPVVAPYTSRIPFDSLKQYYSEPDPMASSHNRLLYTSSSIIIASIFVQMAVVVLLTKYIACYDYSFQHILIENAGIFAIIGVIEFLFFKLIASKYVPTAPSYIGTVFIDRLIWNLKK